MNPAKFFLRVAVALIPLVFAAYAATTFARQDVGHQIAELKIDQARLEERWHAVVARLDAIDKTLMWLMIAVFGSGGVSAGVAFDRARHVLKQSKNGS